MTLTSINPASGDTLATYPEMALGEATQAVEKSDRAFSKWRESSFQIRSDALKRAAQKLRSRIEEFAKLMTLEMGKPITQSRAEIEKCAWLCDYFAENGQDFLKSELVKTDAQKSFIAYEPLGVILAIMPWNFPFWQAFRAAVPALMAGNTMVLKHASNVPGCALAIEKVFGEAGFPEGVFQTLLIPSSSALSLIESPLIKGVTLTGSTGAGRAVGAKAGQFLKKCVLELGGSDPYVILEDADLTQAASISMMSRLLNSGQSCIAAKRFIVLEGQKKRFEDLCIEEMKKAVIGDPLQESTTMGPLARQDLAETLHHQVSQSLEKGAICLWKGSIPEGNGAFYPPTILTQVKKGMPAYDEELFGPVAAIIVVKDEQEAIHVANDTSYGLGAAVFTRDIKRGEHIAQTRLNAGSCFVNGLVRSDPRLPFGGVKESGFGRELSHIGIKEFVNCKTVYVK